jgi:structural maintenance of chromosome 2
MRAEEKSSEQLNTKKAKALEKVTLLKSQLDASSNSGYSKDAFESLTTERETLQSTSSSLQQTVDTLSAQLQGRLSFDYRDPVRGFDRSKVKGLVARLVSVNDPKFATALEVCSSGKLYNVVVDEAITGKALLSGGQLKRRVTIIPLDKIQSRRVAHSKAEEARDMAQKLGTQAFPAIELVGFEEEVRNAIEYVFGGAIVVDGMHAANQICDMTKTRTVTLEGDVYDPSGTISGGSKNNLGTTLERLTELRLATEQLDASKTRWTTVDAQWQAMAPHAKTFDSIGSKLELAQAELDAVQQHLSQTSYGLLQEKYEAMSKEIAEAQQEYDAMEVEKTNKEALYKELKLKEKELTSSREAKLKGTEQDIKKAKAAAAKAAKHAREISSGAETLTLEIEDIKSEVKVAQEAVDAAHQSLIEAHSLEAEQLIKLKATQEEYDDAKAALKEATTLAHNCSSELARLSKAANKLEQKKDATALDAKKVTLAISKCQKDLATAESCVASMLQKHAWIESEKEAFGVEGGDYDFTETNPKEMSDRLQFLKDEQDSLVRDIVM